MIEIEFVCVNSDYENSTTMENQNKLFQLLKNVKNIIVYRQDFTEGNNIQISMAVILIDKKQKEKVINLAKECNVLVDIIDNVSDEYVDRVKSKDIDYFLDSYDTIDIMKKIDEIILKEIKGLKIK
jgi:hypothetical protein